MARESRTVDEVFWMGLIASLPCLVCVRFLPTGLPVQLHHLAKGSSIRSHFAVAPLCGDKTDGGHHEGAAGFHGMGERAFCALYDVPFRCEYGLLIWRDEDLTRRLRVIAPAIVTRLGRLRV